MFAIRTGFFYENPDKGNREFMTVGASIKYSVATLHVSYNIPVTSQHNPLDNTFGFSLAFQFDKGGLKKKPVDDGSAPAGDNAASPSPKGKKQPNTAPPPNAPAPPSDPDPTKQ
jgi:hypothetical protein